MSFKSKLTGASKLSLEYIYIVGFKNSFRTDISLNNFVVPQLFFYSVDPPGKVFSGYPMVSSTTHWITRKGSFTGIYL